MKYFRSQLILINLGLLFLAVIVLIGSWWINKDFALEFTYRRHLERLSRVISYETEKVLAEEDEEGSEPLQNLVTALSRVMGIEITVVGKDGRRWSSHPPRAFDETKLKRAIAGGTFLASIQNEDYSRVILWQLYSPLTVNEETVGAVIIAQEPGELESSLAKMRWPFTLLMTLIGLGTLFISFLMMNKIVRPIQELEEMARRVADGELTRRVRYLGPNELGRLGTAVNEMAEKLAKSIERSKEEKSKLEMILENMDDGLLVFDVRFRLELINRAAEKILNLRREKALNRSIPELLIHPDLEDWVKEAVEKEEPVGGEFQVRGQTPRYVQAFIVPFSEESVQRSRIMVLLRDLTQLRRLEQVRQDFVANVSHELRTPVTSIRALAETLMEREATPEERNKFLQGILQESRRMSYIVNDLLILAQLDAGKAFRDPYQPFSLEKLVRETTDRLFSDSVREIVIELPPDLPSVAAQEDRIRQVLVNLLDNAEKYTPKEGKITISARKDENRIEVRVADSGPGIPPPEQERIFERFYRIDKARSRAIGGTGLGLSIVRRIVEGYGGKVWVESEEGRGATFVFTLPTFPQAPKS